MTEEATRELDGLIQGYLDETLTDEEARRLQELLKADDRNLDEFIRAADLHGVLAGLRSDLAPKGIGSSIAQDEPDPMERLKALLRVSTSPRSKRWRFLKVAGGLAAAVGFVLVGNAFTQPEIHSQRASSTRESVASTYPVNYYRGNYSGDATVDEFRPFNTVNPSGWKYWGKDQRKSGELAVGASGIPLFEDTKLPLSVKPETLDLEKSSKSSKPDEMKPEPLAEPSPEALVAPTRPPPMIPSADKTPPVTTLAAKYDDPVDIFEPRPVQDSRKVVRNAEAAIEVDSYDAAYAKLLEVVAAEKGYVTSGDIQKMPNGKIQANVTLRVPSERFDVVLGKLKELGSVKYQNIKAEDVTKAYFDLQAKLKSKELLLERLKTILKEAKGTAKELMEVEVQIGATQEAIDQIRGELRYYDTVVSMSTLVLGLVEKDLGQPFEYVQALHSTIGLTARDADDAYARAQKDVTEAGGQVVDSRMNRQSDGSATGTIKARVDAEKFPALREALKKLGRVTNDTVDQQKTARGGAEGTPKPDAPLKKEQAIVDLTITTPPIVVTRQAKLLVETATVQDAYLAARRAVEAAGGRILTGSLVGRAGGTEALVVGEVDADKFSALVDQMKSGGTLKNSAVKHDLPAATSDGQAPLLRERATVELTLVSPPDLIGEDHGLGKTIRDTFAGSWKGILWSVEKLFVGLSLAGPWLALLVVGWFVWRRLRKKKQATAG